MPISTIGDMSQHFQSLKNTGSIKTQLAKLSQEMSTGIVSDIASHLFGETTELTTINHEIGLLKAFQSSNSETARSLGAMQLALQSIDEVRGSTAESSLMISADSNRGQVENTAMSGRTAFIDTVNALNSSSGGRSMFAGTAVDQAAMADAETMLASISAAVGGASTKDAVIAAIDDWFDLPGGGFETIGYLGNQEGRVHAIDPSRSIEIGILGDDPSLRELMKGLSYSAIAADMSGSLSDRPFADLVKESGVKLIEVAEGLSHLQGKIGNAEADIVSADTSNASQLVSFEIARSDLIKADPFETATKLQDVQTQLETHYAVTARLSRLNLVDFLR